MIDDENNPSVNNTLKVENENDYSDGTIAADNNNMNKNASNILDVDDVLGGGDDDNEKKESRDDDDQVVVTSTVMKADHGGIITATKTIIMDVAKNNQNYNDEDNAGGRKIIDMDLFELPETPDIIELLPDQRVVAIGDIHGDATKLVKCLIAAGVVVDDDANMTETMEGSGGEGKSMLEGGKYTSSLNWTGGNTILVQVGDFLDRGTQEVECILLLCKLARQAKDVGGAVVILWGNHEIMNSIGYFKYSEDANMSWSKYFGDLLTRQKGYGWLNRYIGWEKRYRVFSRENNDKTADPARWAMMEPGSPLSVPFLSKLKVMVKVGRTVFVHAGFTANDVIDHSNGKGISGLNQVGTNWILKKCQSDYRYGRPRTPKDHDICWRRDYSFPPNREPCNVEEIKSMVDKALKIVDADRMVVGHTVQRTINSVLDGKVWRIDTGYRNPCAVLEITRIAPAKNHNDDGIDESKLSNIPKANELATVLEYKNTTACQKE